MLVDLINLVDAVHADAVMSNVIRNDLAVVPVERWGFRVRASRIKYYGCAVMKRSPMKITPAGGHDDTCTLVIFSMIKLS